MVSQQSSLLAPLAFDSVLKVIDRAKDRNVDLKDIKVIKKLGGTVEDIELVDIIRVLGLLLQISYPSVL